VSAKRVVLELLTATDGHELSAAQLIAGAGVVGVSANNVRVTLTRLVAAGTLALTGRGQYKLGGAITERVASWRDLEKSVRAWDGAWVMAHAPGRDAARDRWLALLGLRELAPDLFVRPDNLTALGPLRELATVWIATGFDAATEARARGLWSDTPSYAKLTAKIERWLAGYAALPLRRAAREAFTFGGGEVLRVLAYDPRLPEPLVDVAARKALVDAMVRLDRVGRALWARLAEEIDLAA
jgi:phenylacetic acid degradation operon negative regulatory protein